MVFRTSSGMRREMFSVEGRSFGKVTSLALLQSTYSVLSFPGDSQKARSCSSLENLGMGFNGLLINSSLLPAHHPRRDGTNERSVGPLGVGDVQPAIQIGAAQRMKSPLALAVFQIIGQQQRLIEKDLLDFRLAYAMLVVLPGIAFVPVEPCVEHGRPLYMSAIYHWRGRFRKPMRTKSIPQGLKPHSEKLSYCRE